MKSAFVLCVMIYLSAAAPTPDDAQAKILSYENKNDGKGNYEFSFKTSNGIERSESGRLVNVGQSDEHMEVHGFYSFMDPEGKIFTGFYSADNNGFHVGDDLPMIMQRVPIEPVLQNLPAAAVASLLG